MFLLDYLLEKLKKYKEQCQNNNNEVCKNITIYELTPTSKIEDKTYSNYLKAAIDKSSITNIALSGPYGSGKSSILKDFVDETTNKYKYYKFLNISLATFEDDKNDYKLEGEALKKFNDDKYKEIEKCILQQMFYSVEQKEIPNSRFKRIKFNKYLNYSIFCYTIWIVSVVELFTPYTFIYHFFGYFNSYWILSSVFAIGAFILSKKIFNSISNVKLSKFIVQNQEISFDNDAQTSILNANIDEILYFFNETKYNVVIIEDLDRFNNTEIFVKLREVNTLLNNRKDSEKITFIYAIKDDMFKDKDRTKFFDYIIPVVPFINSSNSSKKIIDLLKNENLLNEESEENNNKVDAKFIKDISLYINDMRFLTNVFNEFIQYTNKLAKDIDLNYNSLFAISLYKNYKPDDFAKLHNNQGILYSIFSNKYKHKVLNDITKNLNIEITDLTKNIDTINSLSVQNIEELRSLYLYHFCNKVKQTLHFIYVNNSRFEILNLIQEEEPFDILSKTTNEIQYLSTNSGYQTNSNITFKQLEKLVDEDYSYEEKKAAIEIKNKNSIDELKKQRELKQKELSTLRAKSIHELLDINDINETVIINKEYLNECIFNEVIEDDKKIDVLKDDLLMYLLRYGHIKEDYFKYISYYHSGQETPTDINFILNIQRNGNSLPYDLELTHFDYIFTELNSVKHFSKKAILNYSLMHTLLNNHELYNSFKMIDSDEKYSNTAINIITNQFIQNMDEYFDFIDNYIEFYNDISILEHPSLWIKNLWGFIMMHKDFSTEKKDKYFYLIFEINKRNKDLELLKRIDKDLLLSQYIINKKTFKDFVNNIGDFESFKEFLISKGLRFKRLDDIDYKSEEFNLIYENNFYRINFEWVKKILHAHLEKALKLRNYSCILTSNKPQLISYIHNNINEYVEDVLLINGYLEDDEKDIIQLLNNNELKNDNKIIIIDRYKNSFNDISEIINFSWEHLLKNNKIVPSLDNLETCLDSSIDKKYTQDFLNLESTYNAIFDISNKYDEDEIKKLKLEDIIFDSKNIEIATFEAFLKSINYKYEFFPENLEHQFMQYMIELKKVETNPENYQILIDRDFNELAFKLIENEPDTIIETLESFNIDYEILVKLMSSYKFNDTQKINLLNILNITKLLKLDDENKTFRDILYDLKIKYFNDINDEIFNELMISDLSEDKKVELFVKYKFKNRDEVTNAMLNINVSFEKLSHLVSGPISLNNSTYNLKLVKKLKEINYISSYSEKNKNTIVVYTFQTEKEII